MHVPFSGDGLHEFILKYTRREIIQGKTKADVERSTWELTFDKGRPHPILEKEIEDAVDGAIEWFAEHPEATVDGKSNFRSLIPPEWRNWHSNAGIKRPPPWSKWVRPLDRKLVNRIINTRLIGRLRPKMKYDFGDLFANYDFPICLAPEVNQPYCQRLSVWLKHRDVLPAVQWMVPNPCLECGVGGWVKSDRNADERIWVIIEFDRYSPEEQTKLLFWLDRAHAEWELSMIVYSGGKSLHGWFSCVDMLEHREIVRFFRVATTLGCDFMMRSSVQYTRFPGGINRRTQREQAILHWNQEAIDLHKENLARREERYNEPEKV
jgi:hypothetical protein